MTKVKKIPLIVVFSLMLGFLFLVHTSYATDPESLDDGIERVEIGENSKTIYYRDGHKEMFVTCSVAMNIGTSAGVSYVVVLPPPNPIDFLKILKEFFGVIKQFVELLGGIGLGGALLAWKIWNRIKSLRRHRPPIYLG